MLIISKLLSKISKYYFSRQILNEYLRQDKNQRNERPIEYNFVFECISEIYPNSILDIGTGKSSLPHLLSLCGFNVTATDNVVNFWKDNIFNRHYHIVYDDICKTKLNRKFDFILCVSVLEHIQDYDKAVLNMVNLINKNGYLLLTFPYNENTYIKNAYDLCGSNAYGQNNCFSTQIFSKQNINNWISNFGLEIIKQYYWKAFSGDFWSVGTRIIPPKKVTAYDNHDLLCLLFKKSK